MPRKRGALSTEEEKQPNNQAKRKPAKRKYDGLPFLKRRLGKYLDEYYSEQNWRKPSEKSPDTGEHGILKDHRRKSRSKESM